MTDPSAPETPRDEPAGTVAPGTLVGGKYRIERLLGEGAIGTVYLAHHPRLDLPLAVKVLQSSVARDRQSVERFERGARNLSRVNHPHVCRLYDFGEAENGELFLVMEYVEGESLADLIAREGPLPPRRACRILLHICRALHAAHEAGIVHRDLKPGNVMLGTSPGGQEIAKVVDFDIAKQSEVDVPGEVTQVGYVIGTPEYMSPEQLTGHELDGRSDLYSAGTILYRCLTGKLPFDKPTTREIMLARLTEDPLPAASRGAPFPIPDGIQALLDKALSRERDGRWDKAADMAKAVARFTDGGYDSPPAAPVLGGEETIAVPATQVTPAVSESKVDPAPVGTSDAPDLAKASLLQTSSPNFSRNLKVALGALAVVSAGAFGIVRWSGSSVDDSAVTVAAEPGAQSGQTSASFPDDDPDPTQGTEPNDGVGDNPTNGGDPSTEGPATLNGSSDIQTAAANAQEVEAATQAIAGMRAEIVQIILGEGPPPTRLAEIIDRGSEYFARSDYPPNVRVEAACAVAEAHMTRDDDARGDRAAAVEWADRATTTGGGLSTCSGLGSR